MCRSANPLRPRTGMRVAGLTLLFAVLCVVANLASPTAFAQDPNSDDMIYDRVIRKLVNDPELKTNALEITVENRVVTVTGQVASEKLRRRVEKVIKDAKGVKDVVNRVTVRT